jgi:hypothetical protein
VIRAVEEQVLRHFSPHRSAESICASQSDRLRRLVEFCPRSGDVLGLEIASECTGFLVGSAVLVVIGVTLIVLAPGKHLEPRVAAT